MTTSIAEKEGFAGLILRMRADGITDRDLITALERTPRPLFVPPTMTDAAYSSRLIPIDCGAFMEGADLAVRLLSLLKLEPGQRILEIGTGSGFTAAVAGRIVERVFTMDRYRTLLALANQRFEHLGIKTVATRLGDGTQGLTGEGTFDRILATAAFSSHPRHFAEQLVSGGIMIAPLVLEDGTTMMVRLIKTGSRFEREDLFRVPYDALIPRTAAIL